MTPRGIESLTQNLQKNKPNPNQAKQNKNAEHYAEVVSENFIILLKSKGRNVF